MAESPIPTDKQVAQGSEAIKEFQLTTEGIAKKTSKEYGLAISKDIWAKSNTGVGGYYYNRNARFFKNRNYANGRLNIQQMFQDRFNFNGKENYINLNWQALQIVNRIISGLVGRWMQRNEKIQVQAIDTLSIGEKKQQYEELEFLLYNRQQLEELQKETGVQLIPENEFIPADKEELYLWQAQFQRLPEEILYELGCNDVLGQNGWYDVLKEKMLHDAAEVLFVGTYTWMDSDGVIHVKWVKPEDAIYSYSEYPDFRDTTWRGEAPSLKLSEVRKRFGKEFNPNDPFALTEEELWELAQKCKEFQYATNLTWTNTWYNAYMRPYDEWNLRALCFEFKSLDSEPYTVTKTKTGGTTYVQKGYPVTSSGKKREKPLDNQRVVEDKDWNIYEGVYFPDADKLVRWKIKDNMIRPQDPKEIGSAEFSYSFFMPQNYQMRNMAIPEKIEAAVDGMILALLKMQQVVARMRPTGAAVDESALQNIDYGLGDAGNKSIDYKKLYDQTGDIYYRGIDAEGNRVPVPITELQNSGFLAQMDGLIRNYQFNYQILKDELGEDPNLMSAALQPRVTAGNVEASQAQSEAATDYIYRAYSECMKITARKISCLLKDSVSYGAKAYRNIVGAEDLEGRQFSTDIKLLPTQFEVQRFEAILNQAIATNQDLVLFLDPFQLMRVAREDVKLAELLYRQATKKMILHQQQTAMENQKQTIEGQMASAQAAEEAKRETAAMLADLDIKSVQMTGEAQNRTSVLNGVFQMLQKQQETGNPIPSQIMPLVNAVMENVALSAVVSTQEQKEQIQAKMQEQQMMQEQMQQQMMQQQQQGGQQMEQQQNQQQPVMV